MAAPTQYTFDLNEAAVALIKEAGIHEGMWFIGFEFVVGGGMFGAMPTEGVVSALGGPPPSIKPGAFVQIQKVQLNRQPPGSPPPPFAVDAAVVNPDPAKTQATERA